jgi:hypothetical protein
MDDDPPEDLDDDPPAELGDDQSEDLSDQAFAPHGAHAHWCSGCGWRWEHDDIDCREGRVLDCPPCSPDGV